MTYKNILPGLTTLFLLLMILFITGSCSPAQKTPAMQGRGYHFSQATLIQADSTRGYTIFPQNHVLVRTIYSEDSLMVEVRTGDTTSLRSMLINGVSIWIDPEGKQNRKYKVAFQAARSEMFRNYNGQEEQQPSETPRWVNSILERPAVLTDEKGTRFVSKNIARAHLDERGNLVYYLSIAFSQLGTSLDKLNDISIGVTSELHQAVMANQQGGGGVATRPDIGERRPRQQQQSPNTGPRIRFIPIDNWVLISLNKDTEQIPQNVAGEKKQDDDVYFRKNEE
jgi:hypothetical protein